MPDVSIPNYGLLQGLGEGLKQGFLSYQNTKNIQHQQQMDELMTGMRENPDTGQLEYTPQKQTELQAKKIQNQGLINESTPGTQESLDLVHGFQRDWDANPVHQDYQDAKGVLHKYSGARGKEMFPETMSGAKAKELSAALKTSTGGELGYLGNVMRSMGTAPLVEIKKENLEETKNTNAAKVGHEYESDPIIKNSKIKSNAMAQSSAILNNPNKPVTSNDFNAAYQDYLAGTAPGGVPTEGKAHREIPDTFELAWNKLKARVGQNDDLRADPTGKELIGLLQKNIASSRLELDQQRKDQAKHIHENYLSSTNKKVRETNERKFQEYQTPSQPLITPSLSPEDQNAINWARANPNDPRAQQILQMHGVK